MTAVQNAPTKRSAGKRHTPGAVPIDNGGRGSAKRTAKGGDLLVGRAPRADLLPAEVHRHRRERAVIRRAWLAVVLLTAVMVGAVAATSAVNARSAADLSAAQSETASLLAQKREFAELQGVVSDTARLRSAQEVGGSTEIDWSDYLAAVQQSLPAGVTITSVTADSATAVAPYTQGTSALQGARIGTLTFTATSPTLPQVPDWLDSLRKLPGYVDGTANSVTLADSAGSSYSASITLHVDEGAYDNRYSDEEK